MRSAGATALTGVAAAAAALTVTEVVGVVVDRHRPTVVAAVAGRLVVALAGPLRGPAIDVFGVYDKHALVVGIVVVALVVGGLLGIAGRRWPWVPLAGFCAFGALGVHAAARDPLASAWSALLAVVAGVVAGESVRRALARSGAAFPDGVEGARRRFLVGLASTGVLIGLGLGVARQLQRGGRRRRVGELPTPDHVTPVPATDAVALPGLATYITPNQRFYRIDTAIFVPDVDVAAWTLSIEGMVERSRRYSYDDLLAMRCVEEPVTLACISNDVGGKLVGNARWLGVPLADLLGPAGVHPAATQIVASAVDDFTVDVSTAAALDGRVAMVALGMNGEPLPPEHGYPARLVIAGYYGYASATKWLSALVLGRREEHESFWVSRGWDKDGLIKLQSRVDVPASGAEVAEGRFRVAGVAWAPPIGISRVEVQFDRGPWMEATLGPTASGNTWVQWYYDWVAAGPGGHICAVRATDALGNLQTDVPSPAEPAGATGWHYRGFSVVV